MFQSYTRCLFCAALVVFSITFLACNQSSSKKLPTLDNLNVILIMVDTLSAKHTSVYNPELDTTPELAKFAKNAVVFENAYSTAPWTKPALASVFTGLYPSQHKANALYVPLDLRFETLPERMKDKGFRTVGYVSHVMLSEKNGFTQGFDEYALTKFKGGVHDSITSDQVTDQALAWLTNNGDFSKPSIEQPGSRFFMFLHYFDPHFAYQHHKEFDRTSWYKGNLKPGMNFRYLRENADKFNADDMRYLVGLYHEEILYTDQQIGRLFDGLKEKGLDENTLIIFFADHGEEFMDHGGMGHSHTLYNELIKVPLMVALPGAIKPTRVKDIVGTIDIISTIEDLEKTPKPEKYWQGQSLKASLVNSGKLGTRPVYSEVSWDASKGGLSAHKVSVIENNKKLIFDKRTQAEEYYDLNQDPDETKDLIGEVKDSVVDTLKKLIGNFIVETQKPVLDFETGKTGEVINTQEEIDQLRSLGYL